MSTWQDDEDLLASLKAALREAEIVPPRFVDLGRAVYRPTPEDEGGPSRPEGSVVSPRPD